MSAGETDADDGSTEAELEAAAWDELPEPAYLSGSGLASGDDDACARIEAGGSSDWRVRLLQELAFDWDTDDLRIAQSWLDHCDELGFLEDADEALADAGQPGPVALVPGLVEVHEVDAPADQLVAVFGVAFAQVLQRVPGVHHEDVQEE